ncbi:DUF421 domain-containing protein [Pararhodobacter oceanensis]|uniref:DUF421 domain-containing protein n=1 Tax=Pararhodobacter oceanensis TaxID=2172121 RepID=A0A2T8HQK5_9RHOB|nr:YetF domain-containing protein [Pararhodobacter oceanensis]PVH27562.1 DUF421 domain-containing protein [Pararhodobacter oceanensis]
MFTDAPMIDALITGILLSAVTIAWVVLLVRIVGLRSFSKMTNFDFVTTVAMGSLLAGASQSQDWVAFVQTLAAMASLFAVQYIVSRLRYRSPRLNAVVQNTPVFLMKDGRILEDALRRTRVSKEDLIAKLREANVQEMAAVHAVVLETTGNISVLHGGDVDAELLTGIAPVETVTRG